MSSDDAAPAAGGHGAVPVSGVPAASAEAADPYGWPLFEVFVRSRRGLSHNHVGSLHAADADGPAQRP